MGWYFVAYLTWSIVGSSTRPLPKLITVGPFESKRMCEQEQDAYQAMEAVDVMALHCYRMGPIAIPQDMDGDAVG